MLKEKKFAEGPRGGYRGCGVMEDSVCIYTRIYVIYVTRIYVIYVYVICDICKDMMIYVRVLYIIYYIHILYN